MLDRPTSPRHIEHFFKASPMCTRLLRLVEREMAEIGSGDDSYIVPTMQLLVEAILRHSPSTRQFRTMDALSTVDVESSKVLRDYIATRKEQETFGVDMLKMNVTSTQVMLASFVLYLHASENTNVFDVLHTEYAAYTSV